MPPERSPQLEDGHIRIVNEVFDAIMRAPFSANERRVLDAIMRKTYGWQKAWAVLSLREIARVNDMDPSHVSKAMKRLRAAHVVEFNDAGEMRIQKRVNRWDLPRKKVAEPATPKKAEPATPKKGRTCPNNGAEPATLTGQNLPLLSDDSLYGSKNNIKDRSKDTLPRAPAPDRAHTHARTTHKPEAFDRFWDAYPKKKAKAAARKAWDKLKPTTELMVTMASALTAQKQQAEWTKENGQYIPNPATWLNGKRWEDEIGPKASVTRLDNSIPARMARARQQHQDDALTLPGDFEHESN